MLINLTNKDESFQSLNYLEYPYQSDCNNRNNVAQGRSEYTNDLDRSEESDCKNRTRIVCVCSRTELSKLTLRAIDLLIDQ